MTTPPDDDHLSRLLEHNSTLMASVRARIQTIEAEAESADRLVRVRVNASGFLLGVTLHPGTSTIDRKRLGELITGTAHQAARIAAERLARELESLTAIREEILRTIEPDNPAAAATLRRTTLGSPPTAAPPTPPQPTEAAPPEPIPSHPHEEPIWVPTDEYDPGRW